MLFHTFKVDGAVDQRGNLEFVLVAVFHFGAILQEMDVFPVSNLNGGFGFSTKFMEMAVCEIGVEFYLVDVAVSHFHGFPGHGAEPVVVALSAFDDGRGASGKLMHMLLFLVIAVIIWKIHGGLLSDQCLSIIRRWRKKEIVQFRGFVIKYLIIGCTG